ncbi:MAG TPA: hypothetical protein VGD78_08980 [Chthoniobacterales bacterium]
MNTPRVRKAFALRRVDGAERAPVEKLAGSRKAEARLVERAAIVWRYLQGQSATAIAAALRRPRELNLPVGCWSLDRLTACLHEHKRIAIKRSRVGEILLAEGLRWRKQEAWSGAERVGPDFAQTKGGPRAALPRTARRQRGALPGREGPRVGQKPPGPRAAADRPRSGAARGPRPARN